ncbi:MAG: ATP-binding cassette domain-containing protein [Calditrichia bacterium]
MQPIVEVQNLSAQFDERVILKNISFDIMPNEITVILGKSGCGKTTVLKHLVGLYELQQGTVRIMDYDINEITEDDYADLVRKMGVLFQNGALLNSLSVAENVAVPLEQNTLLSPGMIDYLVRVKLQLVELEDAYSLYPSQLSGGMRKRVALARALALDPPLLFCDEPSAGLDPVTLAALDDLFLNLRNSLGITLVLVTHEIPSIRRLADHIIFLDDGQVLFSGPLDAALKSDIPQIGHFFEKEIV